jgi:predicted transcriptional regulator of viral defense system
MPRRISKITSSQPQIARYLNSIGKSAFTTQELQTLITINRTAWQLPASTTEGKIIQKWIANGFITRHVFQLSNETEIPIYLYGQPSIFEIAVTLRPKSYISHYPAVFLHDLTTQIPKIIYTTQELSQKRNRPTTMTQAAIDRAFSQPQRRAQLQTQYNDNTILLLSGMYSNRSGVLLSSRYNNAFSYTNIERTLIDITVRPNYAGGAFAVLDAYRKAIESDQISSNKLNTILSNTRFLYPYPQAIGFYLEKAGYHGPLLAELQKTVTPFQFYLDYAIEKKSFNEKWNIWHPSGM